MAKKQLKGQEKEVLSLLADYSKTFTRHLTIKDHPFVDGNKRIASFLFVYFLDKNDYLFKKSGEKKINFFWLALVFGPLCFLGAGLRLWILV